MMRLYLAVVLVTTVARGCFAGVVEFIDDFDGWQDAAGDTTPILFTEAGMVPEFLYDQYEEYGVLFPETDDVIDDSGAFGDLWGAKGNGPTITADFAEDIFWVGVDFPGNMQVRLFRDGEMIFQSGQLAGYDFYGVVTDEPFDVVVFHDQGGFMALDNLYIPTIPAPPAAALLIALGLRPGRRRR